MLKKKSIWIFNDYYDYYRLLFEILFNDYYTKYYYIFINNQKYCSFIDHIDLDKNNYKNFMDRKFKL